MKSQISNHLRGWQFIAGGLGPLESHKLRVLGAIPRPATGSLAIVAWSETKGGRPGAQQS